MKFSIKDFFSKCGQIRSLHITKEILNGKLHFLCSELALSMVVILKISTRSY